MTIESTKALSTRCGQLQEVLARRRRSRPASAATRWHRQSPGSPIQTRCCRRSARSAGSYCRRWSAASRLRPALSTAQASRCRYSTESPCRCRSGSPPGLGYRRASRKGLIASAMNPLIAGRRSDARAWRSAASVGQSALRRTALACEQPISSTPRGSFARSRIVRSRSGAPWARYCAWWRHCRLPTRAQDWPPRTGSKSSPSSYLADEKAQQEDNWFCRSEA